MCRTPSTTATSSNNCTGNSMPSSTFTSTVLLLNLVKQYSRTIISTPVTPVTPVRSGSRQCWL